VLIADGRTNQVIRAELFVSLSAVAGFSSSARGTV
jgi:hypothetical protein